MLKNVLVIIFSRDRAMQLDATLKSFFRHCSDPECAEIVILYKTTNDQHLHQYKKLEYEYQSRGVLFEEENSFGDDFLRILFKFTDFSQILGRFFFSIIYFFRIKVGKFHIPLGNILFAVDDTVFVRPFTLQSVCYLLEINPEALGFSLRLGLNTTYCYTLNRSQVMPAYTRLEENALKFKWPGTEADFGYPLEVSSSVYRIADLLPLLSHIPIKNPSGLEGQMDLHVGEFANEKGALLCFNQTVAFSNPVNRVQDLNTNRAGVEFSHPNQDLATLFDDGYRIRVENFDNFTPIGCHQEVALAFEKSAHR